MTNTLKQDSYFFSILSSERIQMTNQLASLISDILNKIHGTSHSERFWRIITMPYISEIHRSRLILEDENMSYSPTLDTFVNNVTPSIRLIRYDTIRYFVKMMKTLGGRNKIKNQLAHNNRIACGFRYKIGITSEVDAFISAYYPFVLQKKTDHEKRKILKLDNISRYSPVFVKNLIKLLPKFYLEHFKDFYAKIPLFEPEKKVFHVSMLETFYMRLLVAKYVENGAKLYYYQHGGFYGEYDFHNAHHNENMIADKFLTWGWKMLPKDVPSKAFRCEKFKNNYKKAESAEYDILLVFPTVTSKIIQKTKEKTKLFFSKIDRKKYPIICARPRPTLRFNRKSVLGFIKKDVNKIDAGYKPVSELISKSKLVLQMAYPSTNMLECFYVDHPVVAILENLQPSKIVKPYYEFFLEKGVFHYSMESLAQHLNNVELDKWWLELIQHPTYILFKDEFLKKV